MDFDSPWGPLLETRLRVMTWNLWWRFGDWRARRDAILTEIRRVTPDVCGLQEVWSLSDDNLAGAIAEELGWHWTWAPSPAASSWQHRLGAEGAVADFGNAVLSRWPIETSDVALLPTDDERADGRLVLRAEVASPFGPIQFFTTQLTSTWAASGRRQEQVAAVCRFIDANRSGAFPPVLTGDFNAPPDADEVRCLVAKTAPPVRGFVLVDAWAYARPLEPGWTWDRRNPHVAATLEPDARIDYVFVAPPNDFARGHVLAVELVGARPVTGVWPSDHFGVLVDLRGAPIARAERPGARGG